MKTLLAITKALSDPNRLRLLHALERGELCVCQLQELLALAPSTTSRHLAILAGAGLVDQVKRGRWVYYHLCRDSDEPAIRGIIDWHAMHFASTAQAKADHAALQQITSISPEELCQNQANGLRCCSSAPATPAEAKWQKAGRGNSTRKP